MHQKSSFLRADKTNSQFNPFKNGTNIIVTFVSYIKQNRCDNIRALFQLVLFFIGKLHTLTFKEKN